MMFTFSKKNYRRGTAALAGAALGAVLAICPEGTPAAEASILNRPYKSDAKSGVEALDWIETRDRNIRKNMETKEQQRLRKDVADMKKALRHDEQRDAAAEASGNAAPQPEQTDGTFGSVSKSKRKNEQPPIAFEGDDVFYDQKTGNVYAKGSVKITRVDGKRVITELAEGNLKEQNVEIADAGQVVNIAPGEAKTDLTGYRVVYNYGRKTGSMENARGKIQSMYITGKRIEFFPDQVVIYNGTVSGCSAKHPDYHMTARRVEIWQDTMVMHSVGYWLGGVQLGWERRVTRDLTKEEKDPYYPEVGYSSEEGYYIADDFSWNFAKNARAYTTLKYSTREHWQNIYGLNYSAGGHSFTLEHGKYEDGNDKFLEKKPTFKYRYSHRIGKSPFTISLGYERGKWKQRARSNSKAKGKDISSMHTEYSVTLTPDAIRFGKKLRMTNSFSYSIIKESYNKSTDKGFGYSSSFLYTPDNDFVIYTGYTHTQRNRESSLFNFDTENYGDTLKWGLSWRVTPKDRFAVGFSKDVKGGHMDKVDYYWFHNFHCLELIFNYRVDHYDNDSKYKLKLQFAPW
ncbi:MAG: hypothetical protein Q4D07_09275 [Selenomonadaceae bacterium]|nr:hypothetical protein [Selenomonadaceae bacterium]